MSKEASKLFHLPRLNCDNVEELANLYIDGELHPALEDRFVKHLANCATCQATVLEVRELLRVARAVEDVPIPEDVSQRLRDNLRKRVGFDCNKSTPQLKLAWSQRSEEVA